MRGELSYRHTSRKACGCHHQSIPAKVLEDEFMRLVDMLTINPDAGSHLNSLPLGNNLESQSGGQNIDLAEQKQL